MKRVVMIVSSLVLFNYYTYTMQISPGSDDIDDIKEAVFKADTEITDQQNLSLAGKFKGASQALNRLLQTIASLNINIISLDLSNNGLTALPDAIKKFPLLRTLQCSHNNFTEIPVVKELRWIQSLNFSHNNIKDVRDVRPSMPFLKELNVASNPIEYVSPSLIKQSEVSITR